MKKVLLVFFSFFSMSLFAQVGIGTTTPIATAALDISSTTKLFYPPRMTTAQRDAISNPSIGGILFNTTLNKLQYYLPPSVAPTDGTGGFGTWAQYDGPAQGQTIQPLSTGKLVSIKASVAARSNTKNIQVKIYTAPNGGTLLGTSDANVNAPWAGSEFNFVTGTWTFNTANLTLNASTTYYFEFTAVEGGGFFIGNTPNSYARGTLYTGVSGSVVQRASHDIDCLISYGEASGGWTSLN